MILFGFMVTTAFVSMWISNGATAAMMVPIIDAFVAVLHNSEVWTTPVTQWIEHLIYDCRLSLLAGT
jgi:di/tricarboxylate transporter